MAKRRKPLLGGEAEKIQSKLRVFANGSDVVNASRAEFADGLFVKQPSKLKNAALQRTDEPLPATEGRSKAVAKDLVRLPRLVHASVFIRTRQTSKTAPVLGEVARKGSLISARLPLGEIAKVAARAEVIYIELGESLSTPTPIVSNAAVAAPTGARKIAADTPHQGGAGVLVGIIDVQGFDFSHPDFLASKTRTRFASIWDQGGTTRPAPGGRFYYGSEILSKHMNAALASSASAGLPAFELEPQSQMEVGSHGTHVASIAAGNLGVCPKAMLAGVLVSMPAEDLDPRKSFYDSSRITDAFDYLLEVAARVKARALVVNISLGTNGHAHDTSSAVNRWIDAELSVPGRAVCVAAGNAGQEAPESDGDLGWVMGRIHTSGRIAARGLTTDIEWIVAGNGFADISENELELWYSAQDNFRVWLRAPGEDEWIGPVDPRQFIENHQVLPDRMFVSIYNDVYHPANGSNHIGIYLSPFLGGEGVFGVRAGTWIVRLEGLEVKDGRYHGWIERDDPRPRGRIGSKEYWNFPSFFSSRSHVDDSTISTLACGERILAVGNLDAGHQRMSVTSSQGPTRDGRSKPDIVAPGTEIVAAKGFAGPDDRWVAMSGTSMASPYVCGVVGLMLAVEPRLTAAQIAGILHRTARALPGSNFEWATDAGFGLIDPAQALLEAHSALERKEVKP